MRILWIVFLFFCCSFAAAQEESAPDYLNARDPFLSVLPKAVVEQIPVEPPKKNVDAPPQVLLRPPSVPPVAPKKPPALHIQGIIWGGGQPQAVMNNAVVQAGDEVSGVKIDSIRKDEVVVLFEGEKIHVRMEE